MAAPTPAQLAANMSALVSRWDTYTKQLKDWLAGVADGGPSSDGKYPLTNYLGDTFLVECPAKQAAMVATTVDSASTYADSASSFATAAAAAQLASETARDIALSYRNDAVAARDLAETYKNTAGTNAANALSSANSASDAAAAAAGSATEASDSATAADDSAAAAAAMAASALAAKVAAEDAAAAAAVFDPALYTTHSELDAAVADLVDSAPATMDTLRELADALGDDPNFATTVSTQLGLKAPVDSPALTGTPSAPTASVGTNTTQLATTAFVIAQVTWTNLAGKPTTFPPSTHTHEISDVSGLQAALDAKLDIDEAPSGTYTPTCAGVSNVNSVSNVQTFRYIRVDNVVFFSGAVGVTPSGTGNTTFSIAPPIPSALADTVNDASGVATTQQAITNGAIIRSDGAGKLLVQFTSAGASLVVFRVEGSYTVTS